MCLMFVVLGRGMLLISCVSLLFKGCVSIINISKNVVISKNFCVVIRMFLYWLGYKLDNLVIKILVICWLLCLYL